MSSLTVEAKRKSTGDGRYARRRARATDAIIPVPLAWFPRLLSGTPEERNNWRYIGDKERIHWPDLDEDISVENLLMGKPSGESQSSFKQWLENHQAA